MAITKDNPQLLFAGSEGTGSHTASYTVGAGVTYLVVGIAEWDGTNITDTVVTFNGVSMTPLQRLHEGTGDNNVMLFGLVSPAVGAHNVVVSRPGNNLADITIGAAGYIGVDTSTPTGTAATGTGSNASPTVSASSATGELVVAALAYDRTFSSRGGGQTQLWLDESDEHGLADEKAGATTTTFTYTMGSAGGWAAIAVPLKPAATGISISSPIATAIAAALAPAILIATLISAPVATATAAAVAPTISVPVLIVAPVATATAAALAPSVIVPILVSAPVATAMAGGVVPQILVPILVAPPVATAAADCPTPTVTVASTIIAAPVATATASCPTPSIVVPDVLHNEWGRMLQSMVAKVLADYGSAGTTPTFKTIAAIHDEDEADEFAKSFPCVLLCFRFARVTDKNAIQGNYFASKAVGEYSAITYQSSGKPDDKAMFGKDGIHELENKVRTSLMGFAPGSQADINAAPLFWASTEPLPSLKTKGGSGLLKSRTTFTIDQLVTATAS